MKKIIYSVFFIVFSIVQAQAQDITKIETENLTIEMDSTFQNLVNERSEAKCKSIAESNKTTKSTSDGTVTHTTTPTETTRVITRSTVSYDPCKANPRIFGYKIQVFNGTYADALKYQALFRQKTGIVADLEYESPEYKVRAGNYLSSGSYKGDLSRIKKSFPSAFAIRSKVWCRLAK